MLVIDQDGNRKIDKDCIITPAKNVDGQPLLKGSVERKRYNRMYKINSSVISEDKVRVKFDIKLKFTVDNKEVEKVITSYVTPVLSINQNYRQEEYEFPDIYFDASSKLYLSGKIIKSDGSEEDFTSNEYEFNEEEDTCFTFDISSNIKFDFCFESAFPMLLVQTSYTNPYPIAEVFIQIVRINDHIISEKNSFYEANFTVLSDELYKILHFDVPEEFRECKLYVTITKAYYNITFFDEKVLILDDHHGLVDVNGSETIDILMINGQAGIPKVHIEFFYVKTQKEGLIISPDGYTFKLIPKIFNAMLIPFYYGSTQFAINFPTLSTGSVKVARTTTFIGDFAFVTFSNAEDSEVDCTIYLTATGIGDQEPNVTIDFSNYQPLIDRRGNFSFNVISINGASVHCDMNGKVLISELVANKAGFSITDVTKPVTFTAICRNSSEKACLIEYPAPSSSGFHLIRYPNRDGISITGRGFLAEAIHSNTQRLISAKLKSTVNILKSQLILS